MNALDAALAPSPPPTHVAFDFEGHGCRGGSARAPAPWHVTQPRDVGAALARLPRDGALVVGVGHSAGATALLAHAARGKGGGELDCMILFEPVLGDDRARARGPVMRAMSERAGRRRATFADRCEARAHLGRAFRAWDSACLEGYLEGGLVPRPGGGLGLACTPSFEAEVYTQMDWALAGQLGRVATPTTWVAGVDSEHQGGRAGWLRERHAGLAAAMPARTAVRMMAGSHFAPLEDPAAFAGIIAEAIRGCKPAARL